MELRPEEISRIIRSQIKHYETKINQSETTHSRFYEKKGC